MKIKGILIKNSYNCFWGQSQGGHPETKSHPRNEVMKMFRLIVIVIILLMLVIVKAY